MAKKSKNKLSQQEQEMQEYIRNSRPEKNVEPEIDADLAKKEVPREEVVEAADEGITECGFDPNQPLDPQIQAANEEVQKTETDVRETIDGSFKEADAQLPDDVRKATKSEVTQLKEEAVRESESGFESLEKAQEKLNAMAKDRDYWKQRALEGYKDITVGTVFRNSKDHAIERFAKMKKAANEKLGEIKNAVKTFARNVKELPVKTEKAVLETVKNTNEEFHRIAKNYNMKMEEINKKKIEPLEKLVKAKQQIVETKEKYYDVKRDMKIQNAKNILPPRLAKAAEKYYTNKYEKKKENNPALQMDKAALTQAKIRLEETKQSIVKEQFKQEAHSDRSDFNKKLTDRINAINDRLNRAKTNPVMENTKEAVKNVAKEEKQIAQDGAER